MKTIKKVRIENTQDNIGNSIMENTYYVITIMYGQNSEYWNSSLKADDYTVKNIENAEGFGSIETAKIELENVVKPYGISKGWNVSYSIDEV